MNSKFDNTQHKKQLMVALEFDADDLKANHNGYLSKRQRKVLNRIRRIWKIMVVLPISTAPIVIILAILDGYRIHDTASSRFGICILIILIAGGFSYHAYSKVHKFNKDLFKGDVLGISGTIITRSFSRRGKSLYISDQIFQTQKPYRFDWFTSGQIYTIFYLPYSKYVLSAKLFGEQDSVPEIPKILKANPPIV
ncbi:MAG: hypothetical protein GC179_15060 [Anaerolineaceae bacterium]|nr:hypothetical protein [Anaerolineaceae bacterium]